jgi:hypothetical protein
MLGAIRRCICILWPGKPSEMTPRGVIPTVCVNDIASRKKTVLSKTILVIAPTQHTCARPIDILLLCSIIEPTTYIIFLSSSKIWCKNRIAAVVSRRHLSLLLKQNTPHLRGFQQVPKIKNTIFEAESALFFH